MNDPATLTNTPRRVTFAGTEYQIGELKPCWFVQPHGAGSRELLPADPEVATAQKLVYHAPVALVELGLGVAHRVGKPSEDLAIGKRLTGRLGGLHLRR